MHPDPFLTDLREPEPEHKALRWTWVDEKEFLRTMGPKRMPGYLATARAYRTVDFGGWPIGKDFFDALEQLCAEVITEKRHA